MSKEMTVAEIEAKRDALAEKQKELTRQLRRAKAQERAEAERKARAEEQARALEFYRFCKTTKLQSNGDERTILEWVKGRFNRTDF